MRLFNILLIAAMAFGVATSANALIAVSHIDNAAGPLNIGDTFQVDVQIDYDGNPAGLTGVFTSAQFDESQLQFVSQDLAQPFFILFGAGALQKVGDAGSVFPGDPAGTVRTAQYGAGAGQTAGAGSVVVAVLTFQVVGAGDGSAEIDVIFNTGDGIFVNLAPAGADLNGTSVAIVPEPGTALLMSLGLAGLATAGRRQR